MSDAGTPVINDPGQELVQAVLAAGYPVSPIPGPNAALAGLVASGLPSDAFLYLGYLPRAKTDRRRLLEGVASLPYTLIFLETPHRLLEALADLEAVLGNRLMCAARELTKLHEELARGTVSQVRQLFSEREPRGEFTLIVAGYIQQEKIWSEDELVRAVQLGLEASEPPAQIAARLALTSGWPRRRIYSLASQIKTQSE